MQQIRTWANNWIDYLTMSGRPNQREMYQGSFNASRVTSRLTISKRRIRQQFPHRTDVIQLIDNVLQALLDDHNGMEPDSLLFMWWENSQWYYFATPDEKESVISILERWEDIETLKKKFWAVKIDEHDDIGRRGSKLSEERVLQLEQCLRNWLQERRDGTAY